jgi:hypothetical protein
MACEVFHRSTDDCRNTATNSRVLYGTLPARLRAWIWAKGPCGLFGLCAFVLPKCAYRTARYSPLKGAAIVSARFVRGALLECADANALHDKK